jgi:hypothetical protein
MKVLRQSADLLVIEEKPWFLGVTLAVFVLGFAAAALAAAFEGQWLAALGLGVVAAAFAWVSGRVVERVWLVFDRSAGTVELRHRNHGRFRRRGWPLARLEAVALQSDFGEGSHTYRLALRLRGEPAPVPMTRYYQSGRGTKACLAAAQSWLSSAAQEGGRALSPD